jgi:hypothetical protein
LAIDAAEHCDRASAVQLEEGERATDKLKRKYFKAKKEEKLSVGVEGFEHGVLFSRRKYRKSSQLTLPERGRIIEDLKSRKMTAQGISDKFQVKVGVIRWMKRDAKKGAPVFKRKEARREEQQRKISVVKHVASRF